MEVDGRRGQSLVRRPRLRAWAQSRWVLPVTSGDVPGSDLAASHPCQPIGAPTRLRAWRMTPRQRPGRPARLPAAWPASSSADSWCATARPTSSPRPGAAAGSRSGDLHERLAHLFLRRPPQDRALSSEAGHVVQQFVHLLSVSSVANASSPTDGRLIRHVGEPRRRRPPRRAARPRGHRSRR